MTYPYGRSQEEKWTWLPCFTEWVEVSSLDLPCTGRTAGPGNNIYILHSPVGSKRPSLSKFLLPLHSKGSIKGAKWGTELRGPAVLWRRLQTCWQSPACLVPTTQTLSSPWSWLVAGLSREWHYVNCRCTTTAALNLCEKYYLPSFLTDRLFFFFHLDPLGIFKDCPDSQMKNVCNHFPYLMLFFIWAWSYRAHGIVPIPDC